MVSDASRSGKAAPGLSAAFLSEAAAVCEQIAALVEEGTLFEWRTAFEMARWVRGVKGSDKVNPVTVAQQLYRRVPAVVESFPSEEDFLQLFSSAWDKVRILPGEDLLGAALRQADAVKLGLRPEHVERATPGYVRFISLAGHLCVALDSNLIKLPCREVAKALGVRHATVSSYRQQAVSEGYMTEVQPHRYKPGGKGEATLFRFNTGLWRYFDSKLTKPQPAA